jgi:hypothetical protein
MSDLESPLDPDAAAPSEGLPIRLPLGIHRVAGSDEFARKLPDWDLLPPATPISRRVVSQ